MTASKDRKAAAPSFKSASLDQLWSCLQRCLLFEEPSSRWTKLISQVERLASGKTKDLSILPFSEQQNCFKSVFGTPENLLDNTARTFNLILSMRDLRLFEREDFDIWFFSQSNEDIPLHCDPVFVQIAEGVLKEAPSEAQVSALAQSWNVVPYWRLLQSFGPWSDDPLADFVSAFLDKLDRLQPVLNANSILSAEAEFSRALSDARDRIPANFQPSLLILVEGNTEAILLPKFLKISASIRSSRQAAFIPCGGANQLLRKYLHFRDTTKLPLLCVMDHDASDQIDTLQSVIREQDRLHIWSVGEIEDTFPAVSLLEQLNDYLAQLGSFEPLNITDLKAGSRRTELLNRLWRHRGLGDFDKVGFAQFQVSRLKNANDIPEEGTRLVSTILKMTEENV